MDRAAIVRETRPSARVRRRDRKSSGGAARTGTRDRTLRVVTRRAARLTTNRAPIARSPCLRWFFDGRRTHGERDGRGLLGDLEALHTGLGHDVHRAGGTAGAGGGADGRGLDGGDERNLGDSHFDVGAGLVTCVRMAREARRGVPKPDPRGRAEARPGGLKEDKTMKKSVVALSRRKARNEGGTRNDSKQNRRDLSSNAIGGKKST